MWQWMKNGRKFAEEAEKAEEAGEKCVRLLGKEAKYMVDKRKRKKPKE